MWRYVAVFCVLTACSGRPQLDPEECYGIYCDDLDNSTEIDNRGKVDDTDDEGGLGNVTSGLARQAPLYFNTKPSFKVVIRRINFYGVRASGLRAPSRVNFQRIHVNTGKPWNSKNASFVAPLAGGYFFAFHGISARNSNFTLALMRNNKYQVMAFGRRGTFQHGSSSAFLFLRRGDVMSLQVLEGALYENPYVNAYNSFSSFMMFRADLN